MKRKGAWICILLAILTIFSGCAEEEGDKSPFSADEVERVEVYRYVGVPAAAEKKTAVERDEIEEICDRLASAGSPKSGKSPDPHQRGSGVFSSVCLPVIGQFFQHF